MKNSVECDYGDWGLEVEKLGKAVHVSPLISRGGSFVEEDERVLVYSHSRQLGAGKKKMPMFEKAGPRKKIYFNPAETVCGIVTCGGLCPGLNDVVRAVTLGLLWQYGAKKVLGFRFGYNGLSSSPHKPHLSLTPESVDEIHHKGGTILSSSRGPVQKKEIVDTLVKLGVNVLFTIGGDGTLRGASEIVAEIRKRKLKIGVVGVPKTIDNDICGVERTFGFDTAVEAARLAILAAHEEAKGAWNGVGLVKLMGRQAGFIAANATLSNSDVNFCFIPEVELKFDGENGFLEKLVKRLEKKHHAVIVAAEGAGQGLMKTSKGAKDASGNPVLEDIGIYLKNSIKEHFKKIAKPVSVKYIDPSYMIRSLPADSQDSSFCLMLGQNAVHAAMAGRTDMIVGYWNRHFTNVPIPVTKLYRKQVDPLGDLWQTVLFTTGQ